MAGAYEDATLGVFGCVAVVDLELAMVGGVFELPEEALEFCAVLEAKREDAERDD